MASDIDRINEKARELVVRHPLSQGYDEELLRAVAEAAYKTGRSDMSGELAAAVLEDVESVRKAALREVRDALRSKQRAGVISDFKPEARGLWSMIYDSALQLFDKGGRFEIEEE